MLRLLCCAVLGLALSGCALTTETIDVPYQPDNATRASVDGASSTTVAVTAVDNRATYRDRVSSKKNGYGMEMAAIIASNDIPVAVGDAVKSELQARGYKIGSGGLEVKIELVKFYNDFKNGMFSGDANAEVSMNVKVVRPDQSIVFSKFYTATGTEPNIQLATGSNARAALIIAFRNVVTSVVADPDLHKALTGAHMPATAQAPSHTTS